MSSGWGFVEAVGFWGSIASLVGAPLAVWALMPGWADYRQWLKDDRGYREKTVATLRGPGWDDRYRTWLEAGLGWLDRRFGEAGSARALGVCTVISLCYAWAAFFIGYGMGAPGRLGEIYLLPEDAEAQQRWNLFAFAAALPPAAFFVCFWLSGVLAFGERKLKLGIVKKRHRPRGDLSRRRSWPSCRVVSALVVLLSLALLLIPLNFMDREGALFNFAILIAYGTFSASGPTFGLAIARRTGSPWLKGLAATLVGALALPGAVVVALALAAAVVMVLSGGGMVVLLVEGAAAMSTALTIPIAIAVVVALAVAFVGAGVLAGAVAGAIVAAGAGVLILTGTGIGAALVVGVAVSVGAGGVGAAAATQWGVQDRRGAFAGGVGVLLSFGIAFVSLGDQVDNAFSILIITFFLVLPLANGFWDWLSWQVSRWLGRDLLKKLDGGNRAWTITWHAMVDAGVAVLLLATLAFALAFGVESYNQFAEARTGNQVYDLATFVRDAAAKPWTEGFWMTAMLISTLVPTFLHFALLLASPLVMLVFASPKRAELATALQDYDRAFEKDAILNKVGWYLARTQYVAWTGAILLTILLLVLFGGFVGMIHQGGLAAYVADIAVFAIDVARWVF